MQSFSTSPDLQAVSLVLPLSVCGAALTDASGKIVFVSDRDGKDQIYVMNADGSIQTRLTLTNIYMPLTTVDDDFLPIGSDDHPVWSPDGTQILFDSNRDGHRHIYLMNADGSGVRQLTMDPDPAHPMAIRFPFGLRMERGSHSRAIGTAYREIA